MSRRLVALGSALTMAAGLVTVLAPVASAADSTTYLDGATVGGDVAVGGGKVFVAANDRIIVADTQGVLTGSITGLFGAVGLAITPDGSRLYAALSGSKEVAEIDTAALTVTRRIDLTAFPCPSNLSLSGNLLWVGYGCRFTWAGGVLSLDLSVTTPAPLPAGGNTYSAPLVAAAGSRLVVGETDIGPADLMVYDVSAGSATLRGVIDGHTLGLASVSDLAITPDGSMAITAGGGNPYDGWDTTSLTKVRVYGAEPTAAGYTKAVAVSPDGAYIAGGRESGVGIALYDAATTAKTYTNDDPIGEPVAGSLTFSGTDIFGVLKERYSNGRLHLWRLHGATLPASTLTMTAPSWVTALDPLSVTGQLALPDGSAPGTQPLVVTRRSYYGDSTTLTGVTTAADGTFTFIDTPTLGGNISYDVLWDGSPNFRWSAASVVVGVDHRPTSLTLSGPAAGIADKKLRFSGALDTGGHPLPPSASFSVERTVSNSNGTVTSTLPAVAPASDGSFSFADKPEQGGQYTYTVQWAGNGTFVEAQASHDVTVRGKHG